MDSPAMQLAKLASNDWSEAAREAAALARKASAKAESSSFKASAVSKGPLYDIAARHHGEAMKASWAASLKDRANSGEHLKNYVAHKEKQQYHAIRGEG